MRPEAEPQVLGLIKTDGNQRNPIPFRTSQRVLCIYGKLDYRTLFLSGLQRSGCYSEWAALSGNANGLFDSSNE